MYLGKNDVFSAICMHLYAFEHIKIDKNVKKHTQRTLFACYNTLYLTELDLKKGIFFAY